jgi:cysteine desulfuration protein SufE
MMQVVQSAGERPIGETISRIIEDFDLLGDWEQRYRHVIDLGGRLPAMPERFRTEAFRLRGCQSRAWFAAEAGAGHLRFFAGSEAAIVHGLIAILLSVYDRRSPNEILAAPPDFLKAIGLHDHLSPARSNGLHMMMARIQSAARAALFQSGRTRQ